MDGGSFGGSTDCTVYPSSRSFCSLGGPFALVDIGLEESGQRESSIVFTSWRSSTRLCNVLCRSCPTGDGPFGDSTVRSGSRYFWILGGLFVHEIRTDGLIQIQGIAQPCTHFVLVAIFCVTSPWPRAWVSSLIRALWFTHAVKTPIFPNKWFCPLSTCLTKMTRKRSSGLGDFRSTSGRSRDLASRCCIGPRAGRCLKSRRLWWQNITFFQRTHMSMDSPSEYLLSGQ